MSKFQLPQLPAFTPTGDAGKRVLERIAHANGQRSPQVIELNPEQVTNAFLGKHAPRVPWDAFLSKVFRWKQGEHVTLLGPTGEGKTTALLGILHLRQYVTLLSTKPYDDTLSNLENKGYLRMDRWLPLDADEYPRRILWPDATTIDSDVNQRAVFSDGMRKMFREGQWCIGGDEIGYITDPKFLGLRKEVVQLLIQGRSLGISMVSATQRPVWLPLESLSQATHLFLWKTNLKEDVDRLSHLNGVVDPATIKKIMAKLERFQFLYVNTRTGVMCRTHAPKIEVKKNDHSERS